MIGGTATSRAKKTAGIAVTYRAASGEMYGTCPDSCPLKPTITGITEIDREYEAAVRRAVPRSDVSARIGTCGRSRAQRSAVVPFCVKQQITLMFVVSAISRAATTMASATDPRTFLRLAAMISR